MNNLGVIAHEEAPDGPAAATAWREAGDLEAATYNLSGEVTGAGSARIKKYAPARKMIAVPSKQISDRIYETMARAEIA